MKALVVYESMYGNTRQLAETVAAAIEGRYDVELAAADEAATDPRDLDLLLVGGPTHAHGLASATTRRSAASAARDGRAQLDPGAAAARGLRTWLQTLEPGRGVAAAAFDTRLDGAAWLTGSAARGIARRLRAREYEVVSVESFLVEGSDGPLVEGELERARTWADELSSGARAHV